MHHLGHVAIVAQRWLSSQYGRFTEDDNASYQYSLFWGKTFPSTRGLNFDWAVRYPGLTWINPATSEAAENPTRTYHPKM